MLSERDVASDSHKPDGVMAFKMRLLERAHKGQVKSLAIPVPAVVKYDLENCRLYFNEQFSLVQEMKK